MFDLNISKNEKIKKYAEYVERYRGTDEETIDELYLTNQNIIFAYKKSKGFFSKSEDIVEKISLNEIKIDNNIVQVSKTKNKDYGWCLNIKFENGLEEYWVFESNKEIQKWVDLISSTVDNKEKLENEAHDKENIEKNIMILDKDKHIEKLIKCPNCGATIDSFQLFCSYCGTEIKRNKVSNAIEEFTNELNRIRSKEMPKFEVKEPNSVIEKLIDLSLQKERMIEQKKAEEEFNKQKQKEIENFIINYPIPNSKEDLFEFLFIVTSNIKLKNNKHEASAWHTKMEQIYKKAQILNFAPNDMEKIQNLYDESKKTNLKRAFEFIQKNIKK